MTFEPDFRHFEDVLKNVRPARLPIYEHIISPNVMERILGASFAGLIEGDAADVDEFFRRYCRFFEKMTYDVVSFEVCITDVLRPASSPWLGNSGASCWQHGPLVINGSRNCACQAQRMPKSRGSWVSTRRPHAA